MRGHLTRSGGLQVVSVIMVIGLVLVPGPVLGEQARDDDRWPTENPARHPTDMDGPELFVMVFNYTVLPRAAVEATLATVERLLGTAELNVRWLRCLADSSPPRDCVRPAPPDRLVLRLLPPRLGTDGRRPQVSLGFAAVDEQGLGVTANVYVQRVVRLGGVELMPSERLAGLVAAHELAHLLLGGSDHSPSGLMRAEWPVWDLRPGQDAAWRFSMPEAVRLRAGARRLMARARDTDLP